ncbi:MAG: sugar ABC transporter permease [Spirochaetaceae bacterium]|jgi:multiple sugar transport system permease protein|nr:sugar ABC transporter permease [Spirochaetaceae bacterium]
MLNLVLYLAGLTVVVMGLISFMGPRLNHRTKAALEPYLFMLPVFLLLALLFGYPLVRSTIMAFQNYNLGDPKNIRFNGLDNIKKLFADRDMGLVIRNSFVYVIVAVLGQFLLGLTLALALRKNFPFRGFYQAVVFLPWAFSSFVIGIMFRWSFNGEYGVVNDILYRLKLIGDSIAWLGTPGLSLLVVIFAMIWMGVPFFAIMILAALQSIPGNTFEAAEVDGCGPIRKFFCITLPYIKPTVIVTILLRTIWIFNSFDMIVVITGGGPASTSQTLPSYMYTRAFAGYDFGLAAAMGLLLMAILAVYAVVFLKVTTYNKAGDF